MGGSEVVSIRKSLSILGLGLPLVHGEEARLKFTHIKAVQIIARLAKSGLLSHGSLMQGFSSGSNLARGANKTGLWKGKEAFT